MVNRFSKLNIGYGMVATATAIAAAGLGLTGCLKRQKNCDTPKAGDKKDWLRNRWHDMLSLMGCGQKNRGKADQADSDQQVPDYWVMQQRSLHNIQGTACDIEMTEFPCPAQKQASTYAETLKRDSLKGDVEHRFENMLANENHPERKEHDEKEFMRSFLFLAHHLHGDDIRPQTYQQKYDFFTRGFLKLIGQDVVDLHQENIPYPQLKNYFDRFVFNNLALDSQKFSSDKNYFKACFEKVQQRPPAI